MALVVVSALLPGVAASARPARVQDPEPPPSPTGVVFEPGPANTTPTGGPPDHVFGTGSDGEVPELRDRFSSTQLVDGDYVTEVSTSPVHYVDEAGAWAPIDTSRATETALRRYRRPVTSRWRCR
jgi:hypothetical protein